MRIGILAPACLSITLMGCVATVQKQVELLTTGVPSEGTMLASFGPPNAMAVDADAESDIRHVNVSSTGIAPMPELQTYTQSVLDRIIAAAPVVNAPPAKVHILANMSPGALAAKSGQVFLHHSVFNYLGNEDQLAFLLAHEYSHVYMQHDPESWLDLLRPYILSAIDIYIDLSDSGDDTKKALKLYGSDIVARNILLPIWDRKLERQADFMGIDLMTAAGYNPAESIRVINVIKTYEDSFKQSTARQRNALEKAVEAKFTATTANSGPFAKLLADLGNSVSGMMARFSSRHDDAEERMRLLFPYIEREYEEATLREIQSDQFAQSVAESEDIMSHYDLAFEVNHPALGVSEGELIRKARVAVSGRTSDHPYTRKAFADLRAREGKIDLALRNLDMTRDNNGYLSMIMEVNRAKWLVQLRKNNDARTRLESAATYYDWPIDAYKSLIPLVQQSGDKQHLNELKLSCTAKFPQNREICGT